VLPAQPVIRALVFDFDGLLVDTEVPIFRAWQRIYREHGQELPLERWLTIIGTASGPFDPVIDLVEKTGTKLVEADLKALEVLYYQEAIAFEDSSNGVQAAKAAGLFCVAVPNPLTADLDLSEADLRLLSLDAMPLREVIKQASPVRKRRAR